MSGVKGRSGRKHNVINASYYFNQLYDKFSYELADLTIKKALAGDRELLIYCHDRRLGKPKQQTEILGGEQIGASLFVELFTVLQERKREIESQKLIGGINGQSVTEREDKGEGKALQEET